MSTLSQSHTFLFVFSNLEGSKAVVCVEKRKMKIKVVFVLRIDY